MTQHVHILGIAGTFMGGVAAIAKAAGFRVTGADLNVYPPMSTQLDSLDIDFVQGYGADQLDLRPDLVVVGNALSRGSPVIEAMLDRGLPYVSGPQWLAENVLHSKHVMAVAGTHGKTTTSSMLAWILEHAGLNPGFLIGGIARDFNVSARLSDSPYFVIEADEYDTAFFDKRAKFVHYRPRTAVLNNLEYDHADIYADVAAIRWQFHQLVRTVPASGRLIVNGADAQLAATLTLGCWTPCETFGLDSGRAVDWSARLAPRSAATATATADATATAGATATATATADATASAGAAAATRFTVRPPAARGGGEVQIDWGLIGEHNVMNALAAMAAAAQAGIAPERAAQALNAFGGVKRRMEVRGVAGGVTVYDDFAHHPTAIATTVAGLRARVGAARIIAVLEPRSNTMKMGVHREQLAPSLAAADRAWFLASPDLGWDLPAAVAALGERARFAAGVDALVQGLVAEARPGDHILVMSNGGFGGLHGKLIAALGVRP